MDPACLEQRSGYNRGVGACNDLVRIYTHRVCSDIGIRGSVCIMARPRAPMSRTAPQSECPFQFAAKNDTTAKDLVPWIRHSKGDGRGERNCRNEAYRRDDPEPRRFHALAAHFIAQAN
jgi:hypothetical protein